MLSTSATAPVSAMDPWIGTVWAAGSSDGSSGAMGLLPPGSIR